MKLIYSLPYVAVFNTVTATFQNHYYTPTNPGQFTQVYGVNCGNYANPNKRIVNGEVISITEAPWQIYLSKSKKNGAEFCGGSIISPRWAITAAHCKSPPNVKIYIYSATSHEFPNTNTDGNKNVKTPKKVHKWINNPYYDDNTLENDIALIASKTAWAFTDRRQPVCLPLKNFCLSEDSNLSVSGFGRSYNGGPATIALNQALVPVYSNAKCTNPSVTGYSSNDIPYKMMFCAGGNNKDSCQGDSGGPIVYKNPADGTATLAGVVSWGFGCNEQIHPGVYTQVSSYLYWIAQVTGTLVQDEDYNSFPPFDCKYNQNRGLARGENAGSGSGYSSGSGSGDESGDYVNILYADDQAFIDAGLKLTPFTKGVIRYQRRCLNWNGMAENKIASFLSKKDKQCRKYSKYTVDYVEGGNRPYIKYDTNTMQIKVCPPGATEGSSVYKSYCLAVHEMKLSRADRKKTKIYYRKGNKKYDAIYLKDCDQFDQDQKFVITNSGRIKIAFKQTHCIYMAGYGGKKSMITTDKFHKCKAAN